MGRNPIEFRRHYDAWIAATTSYGDAWMKALAGDASARENLPALLKESQDAQETFREEWKQLFRSPSP